MSDEPKPRWSWLAPSCLLLLAALILLNVVWQAGWLEPLSNPKPLREMTNSIGLKMVLIPAGEFMMGAPALEKGHQKNETPQHPVRITRPFWMGIYEVTQTEYEQLLGYHESNSRRSGVDSHGISRVDTRNFPVDEVTWYQATEFCNRLSKEEGLPEYYRTTSGKRGKPWKDVDVLGGPGYRLPTEAEWEYACRAGTTTPFSLGESIGENQGNVNRSQPRACTAAVGSYPANAFGLYDMHGNVAEWCNDIYDPRYYQDCPIDDPSGPSSDDPKDPLFRRDVVARGGYWSGRIDEARSAHRMSGFPWAEKIYVGFRVARSNSGDWEERLHDVAARDAAITLAGHDATVMSVAFSPDGKTLVSGSDDRTIKLWDVATAKEIVTLHGHSHRVISVAFSPDGTKVASGSEDKTTNIWDVATGENTATLRQHFGMINCVAYSPDGKTLATASGGKIMGTAFTEGDASVRLWDLATGENTVVLRGRPAGFRAVAFSPDGKTLASGSLDGSIKLSPVKTITEGDKCADGKPTIDRIPAPLAPPEKPCL